ncbi:MAG: decaprenyl-phosphate phosphoribosyltransferase [Bacteroidota bacterium]|nr:decaprenyl-phosphate phosphoribosyltransferase [Bacteroidota bacterium]
MNSYIRLLRPSQWVKNLFVFAPLIFSRNLFVPRPLLQTLEAFAAFCLISSSVYIINDIFDRSEDRAHPVKRERPIASGKISVSAGAAMSVVLLAAAVVLSCFLPTRFFVLIVVYFAMQFFYSLALKQVVILDIFIIAAGFMLRVIGGAEAISVQVSSWIILCTMFLSLFLAAAKRRSELVLLKTSLLSAGLTDINNSIQRKVLKEYSLDFINYMMIISATGMAISYALYTVAQRTVTVFGTEKLIFTTIFVLFGVFRYFYLVVNKGMGENPVAILAKDLPTLMNLCLWFLACLFIIYR